MSKKKNNKQKNNASQNQQQKSVQVIDNFSEEQMQKGYDFTNEEMPNDAMQIPEDSLEDTKEDSSKVEELKKTGNVEAYINYLRDKLKRVRAIEARAEEIKAENIKEKENQDSDRKKIEELRSELNKKMKKVKEEQLRLDQGEYSSVINDLLNSLEATETQIRESTKKMVERLAKKHLDNIEDLNAISKKQDALEDERIKLEELQRTIQRDKKRMESQKSSFEKRVREDVEDEYEDKIQDLEETNQSLERKNSTLTKEVKVLSDFKRQILSAFGSSDMDSMLKEQNELKKRCNDLEGQLNDCHTDEEFEQKVKDIQILNERVKELENKVDETHLSELRLGLHNIDASIIEINTYKARIDSAEAREKSLLRTVDDLHKTLNRLKDEEKAKESAFEQARWMDSNAELQGQKLKTIQPRNLAELVDYLQVAMANRNNDEDCFYYSKKTIRTFLAGLNMSPLSLLQGISGTGKTSLPREIAKVLVAGDPNFTGADDAGNRKEPYRICAVQSGWRDNMDLLGFYNNFEKKYKETDFFKALYLASQPKYANTLFFIILDEMNLSHPEHYFADFLSLMEQDVADRYVKINADEDILPRNIKQRQMFLPKNIRFIGTANHDETTLDFAPKTYDRSNVMVMQTNDKERVIKEIGNTTKSSFIGSKLSVGYEWLSRQFADSENEYEDKYLRFENFIKNSLLKDELEERGIGIGNRFNKQARKFICAYLASSNDSVQYLSEAVDHLITSRLFRSLKNRYDLSKPNLEDFKKHYEDVFKKSFNNESPKEGIKLLDDEIKKK